MCSLTPGENLRGVLYGLYSLFTDLRGRAIMCLCVHLKTLICSLWLQETSKCWTPSTPRVRQFRSQSFRLQLLKLGISCEEEAEGLVLSLDQTRKEKPREMPTYLAKFPEDL